MMSGLIFSIFLAVSADVAVANVALADVVASATNAVAVKQADKRRIERPRPPRRLPPNRVQPGGGLDVAAQACMPDGSALTALVPKENPVYTAQDFPTFLFYFPDAPETTAYAEFIVLSEDEKEEIYSTRFVPSASGIVSVAMSATAGQALVVGEAYHWYLNLHCETTEGVPSVNGWVQRIADGEARETVNETVDESGLPAVWYDAIAQTAQTILNEQRSSEQPRSSAVGLETSDPLQVAYVRWNQLLTAAGLSELVGVPVIDSVTADSGNFDSATIDSATIDSATIDSATID